MSFVDITGLRSAWPATGRAPGAVRVDDTCATGEGKTAWRSAPEVLGRLREPQVPVVVRHLLHQAEGLGRADVPVADCDAEDVDRLACGDVLEFCVPDGVPVVGDPPGPGERRPVLDHVAGLCLAEVLQRLVVGAAEDSAPYPGDLPHVFGVGDLNRLVQPAL